MWVEDRQWHPSASRVHLPLGSRDLPRHQSPFRLRPPPLQSLPPETGRLHTYEDDRPIQSITTHLQTGVIPRIAVIAQYCTHRPSRDRSQYRTFSMQRPRLRRSFELCMKVGSEAMRPVAVLLLPATMFPEASPKLKFTCALQESPGRENAPDGRCIITHPADVDAEADSIATWKYLYMEYAVLRGKACSRPGPRAGGCPRHCRRRGSTDRLPSHPVPSILPET